MSEIDLGLLSAEINSKENLLKNICNELDNTTNDEDILQALKAIEQLKEKIRELKELREEIELEY